jgi:hypothetical protein
LSKTKIFLTDLARTHRRGSWGHTRFFNGPTIRSIVAKVLKPCQFSVTCPPVSHAAGIATATTETTGSQSLHYRASSL